MKLIMKWRELDLVPNYRYAFCPSAPHWNALMEQIGRNEGYPWDLAASATHFKKPDNHFSIVTVRGDKMTRQQLAGLLIHEGMHIWREMREVIGETEPSSEFEAYAMQHITTKLFSDFERTRGKLFK